MSLLSATLPLPLFYQIFATARSKPRIRNSRQLNLVASSSNVFGDSDKQRRSANYHPTVWDPKTIESLTTPYNHESHASDLEEMKNEIRGLLASTKEPCFGLKLIDLMQRLGVAYHFQEEIKENLNHTTTVSDDDLYTTALHFRLLREHAFPVSSDVFDKFRNENGKFKDDLREDVEGLISLYEASHLGMHGEDTLEEAYEFCTKHLNSLILGMGMPKANNNLANKVQQALDIPLHWRMPRIKAFNFINFYQNDDTKNLALLQLAKLDYNLVQSVYQGELKELERWWKDLGFRKKLHFSRDRLVENYLWAMGLIFEPHFSKCRIQLTKFVCILTAIDDIYDVYGLPDELELFTQAVNRWDKGAMEELPQYMKIGYSAMHNFANELAYDVMKNKGLNVLPFLKKEWKSLCKSYQVEARWFSRGHTPSLEEYLENAWISVGGPGAVVHSFMLLENHVSQGSISDCLNNARDLIYWSSLITRLSDDLGTSKAESMRGDVTKSMQCYMIEKGVCEEEAKEHIKGLISYCWKKLNGERNKCSSLPTSLVNTILNMARTAQCIFQYGDGIGTSIGITRDRLISLIVEPIPID